VQKVPSLLEDLTRNRAGLRVAQTFTACLVTTAACTQNFAEEPATYSGAVMT
jgi:hypothetical protein